MKMTTNLALAIGIAIGSAAVAATADDVFATYDIDKNGQITQAEMGTVRALTFHRVDENGDGLVNQSEIDAAVASNALPATNGRQKNLISQRDGNGDATLTMEEFTNVEKLFRLADANRDGWLNSEEVDGGLARLGKNASL